MRSIGIIIKVIFVFLIVKFITLSSVLSVFELYPDQISKVFADETLSSEMLKNHAINVSTLVSSVLTLIILYFWNPLKGISLSKKGITPSVFILSMCLGFLGILLNSFVLSFFKEDYSQAVELSKKLLATGWVGVLPVVVLIPIVEEIVFRKFCISALLSETKPVWAIILSGFLFGVLHVQPVQILGATLLGIVFGWIYYLSKSLLPSIVLHICNNGFYVFRLKSESAFSDNIMTHHESPLFWIGFIVVALLFILISYRLTRNVKYKKRLDY